jgi:alkaline phosphatase
MNKVIISITFLFLCVCTDANCQNQEIKPKNVILYIGDGFGIAPKTAARMAMGQGQTNKKYAYDPDFQVLELDKLRFTGMAMTHSENSWTTDSAPGATVYATGQKIDNEVIAFDLKINEPIETILEKAKKEGYAVGLVTTTRVTHATPASFGSHIWHRDLEDYIAAQLISSSEKEYQEVFNNSPIDSLKFNPERDWILPVCKKGVEIDVIFGGGAKHFLPKHYKDTIESKSGKFIFQEGGRNDNSNLIGLAKKRGYTYVNTREKLLNLDLNQFKKGSKNKALGLFKSSHISYEQDRQLNHTLEPSLADMTAIAIEILKRKGGNKGFFLLVEGGRIDHLGHANAGGVSKSCRFEVDSITFPPDGGNKRLQNTEQGNLYGSDYLIKEVLSFDYAIAEGRKLLKDKNRETLLFSTSDHECGAVALIGLYDSTINSLRTYANEPTQKHHLAAKPQNISRGDEKTKGWFPDYVYYDFQKRKYPKPRTSNSRRLIITYASNPATLGGGCGGNHTPQDVWVGGDDNLNGKYASKISNKGILDNTELYGIMKSFLKLK